MKIQVVSSEESGQHHARIKGDNNEIVWVTETYPEKDTAYEAIDFLTTNLVGMQASAVRDPEGRNLLIEEVTE